LPLIIISNSHDFNNVYIRKCRATAFKINKRNAPAFNPLPNPSPINVGAQRSDICGRGKFEEIPYRHAAMVLDKAAAKPPEGIITKYSPPTLTGEG
jgi:hypothetical protein